KVSDQEGPSNHRRQKQRHGEPVSPEGGTQQREYRRDDMGLHRAVVGRTIKEDGMAASRKDVPRHQTDDGLIRTLRDTVSRNDVELEREKDREGHPDEKRLQGGMSLGHLRLSEYDTPSEDGRDP